MMPSEITYKYCKTLIENKKYKSKEKMLVDLEVLLFNDRITAEWYNELTSLLNTVEHEIPVADDGK